MEPAPVLFCQRCGGGPLDIDAPDRGHTLPCLQLDATRGLTTAVLRLANRVGEQLIARELPAKRDPLAAARRAPRKAPAPASSAAALLLLDEAARLARVTPSTIRHWIATGKLDAPPRLGKRRLVSRAALAAALGVPVSELR